jgi:hypothetical protein
MAQRRCFYSTFMASLIDPHSWRQAGGLALSDIANDPLPLMAAVPARTIDYPDIIVIQHESIFDPRIFGLPIEPTVEAFLSPGMVSTESSTSTSFGGGSWQSEFSLLTGLSSASFGSNAYYLFKQGAGRFHNSLPHALAALGYRTMLASSCRRSFLSYDEFYRSIGIGERIFADDFPPPFDVRQFETTNSDAIFLEAAFAAHTKAIADDPAPRFLYALTNFNHGPHDRRLAAAGQFERERAFAASSLPDAQYAEYYARLAETASTWEKAQACAGNEFSKTSCSHRALRGPSARTGEADRSATQTPHRCAARIPHILCNGVAKHLPWSPGSRTGGGSGYCLSWDRRAAAGRPAA